MIPHRGSIDWQMKCEILDSVSSAAISVEISEQTEWLDDLLDEAGIEVDERLKTLEDILGDYLRKVRSSDLPEEPLRKNLNVISQVRTAIRRIDPSHPDSTPSPQIISGSCA